MGGDSSDASATGTVTETVAPAKEGGGEPVPKTAAYGTIQELGKAVCDHGTFKDTGVDYDFLCQIDGHKVLLTDWSTFGGTSTTVPES